jgi:hypothetical protein
MASTKSRLAAVAVLVVAMGVAAATVAWKDPLLLPGSHRVWVYAVNDGASAEVTKEPGFAGKLLGRCDADTYYVRDGDTRLCLVLTGPLGDVQARRRGGTVIVDADDAASLQSMAALDTGSPDTTTRLVLVAHGTPVAIIPVASIAGEQPVGANALN